jgi:hypothetical protein
MSGGVDYWLRAATSKERGRGNALQVQIGKPFRAGGRFREFSNQGRMQNVRRGVSAGGLVNAGVGGTC